MSAGFWARLRQHDDRAARLVESVFQTYGFEGFPMGVEVHEPEAARLYGQSDPTSILLRYRPDRAYVRKGLRTVLCEIKSEANRHAHFALEFDSWRAAAMWNQSGRHVMLACVDLTSRRIYACWADAFLLPSPIYVPKRWDWEQQMARLRQETREIPGACLKAVPHKRGSGTPFFLLPKDHRCLVPLPDFIRQELLRP